ncbi:crotonase/enoyl-CoA hydratase family protein [Neobacillus niacini]|uniref:crotonase/enoyl-CoA hydratase family protein n=1 Tax=Neobacillus niacini TaxID=86668 RepID=UPI0021CB7C9E|nr:crotonase/enoyl-CoA hydratase family protein [Neobacillus niacini]MCM3764348.1 crotonase/enoyl-CoA hydratase family protein [Neobacillus niacini]
MMDYQAIIVEKIDRIAVITFNRPEALNAVSSRLWLETGTALKEFNEDPDLWVAIITGAGDRAFSAGADLKEIGSGGFSTTEEMQEWGFAGIVRHHISKPVIAAVNGFALGGGTEIALACDLIVASDRASFGLPEVKRGLIAGAGGLLRLPRQIPLKVAMHAILTGKPITAEEAKQWGLVNEVVPHEQVLNAAIALAEEIIDNAPLAVKASKEIVYRGLDTTVAFPPEAWSINQEYAGKVFASYDAKEGPRAFAEKRKPNWTGK